MATIVVSSDVKTLLQSANFAGFRNSLSLGTAQVPTFAGATLTSGTVTADTPIINATQTWNNAAVTFNGRKLNVTDTASAAESRIDTWQLGGIDKLSLLKTGALVWWNTTGTNYERLSVHFSSNVAYLTTQQGGSGTARNLVIGTAGSATTSIQTAGTTRWTVDASGHLVAGTDNSYDIGASGATRPRTIYAGTDIYAGSSGKIGFASRSYMASGSDGVVLFTNAAGSSFTRLQLGGTTTSFPGIERSTTEIHFKLADGSAFTTAKAAKFVTSGDVLNVATTKTPASAGAAGTAGDIGYDTSYIYVCTATNTWKRVAIATW